MPCLLSTIRLLVNSQLQQDSILNVVCAYKALRYSSFPLFQWILRVLLMTACYALGRRVQTAHHCQAAFILYVMAS